MTLLSLDTSTTCSGYAVFKDGELLHYGCEKTDKKFSGDKTEAMIERLYALIDIVRPDIIVTELTVVTRNAQAQRNLTMILGAIRGYCLTKKIFYYSFRPAEWRFFISKEKKPRKRIELKEWAKNMVTNSLNIELDSDDMADAILIGQAYCNAFNQESDSNDMGE